MFDYLWGEIAIIVLGLWMALLFVMIGVLIERVRATIYNKWKDKL